MDSPGVSDGGDPGAVPDAADGNAYVPRDGDTIFLAHDDSGDGFAYLVTAVGADDHVYTRGHGACFHTRLDHGFGDRPYSVLSFASWFPGPTPGTSTSPGRPQAHGLPLPGDERAGDERPCPGAPVVAGGGAAGGRGGGDGGRPDDGGGVRHDAGAAAGGTDPIADHHSHRDTRFRYADAISHTHADAPDGHEHADAHLGPAYRTFSLDLGS